MISSSSHCQNLHDKLSGNCFPLTCDNPNKTYLRRFCVHQHLFALAIFYVYVKAWAFGDQMKGKCQYRLGTSESTWFPM